MGFPGRDISAFTFYLYLLQAIDEFSMFDPGPIVLVIRLLIVPFTAFYSCSIHGLYLCYYFLFTVYFPLMHGINKICGEHCEQCRLCLVTETYM